MGYRINDFTEILLRFDRIGMREFANEDMPPPECPVERLRNYKNLSPEKWLKLTRAQRGRRAEILVEISEFERRFGITL